MKNSKSAVSETYSKYGPHPIMEKSRNMGIVMTSISAMALIYSFFLMAKATEKFRSLTEYYDPSYNFINPENIGFELSLISVMQAGALIVLVLGIYRIIFSRKSTTNFAVCTSLISLFLIFISVIPTQGTHKEVKDTLLANQHIWAEKRYGVIYDEITTREVENGRRDYDVQDKVLRNGEPIASVCERDNRQTVAFCNPGTDTELSIILAKYGDDSTLDKDPKDELINGLPYEEAQPVEPRYTEEPLPDFDEKPIPYYMDEGYDGPTPEPYEEVLEPPIEEFHPEDYAPSH